MMTSSIAPSVYRRLQLREAPAASAASSQNEASKRTASRIPRATGLRERSAVRDYAPDRRYRKGEGRLIRRRAARASLASSGEFSWVPR